MKKAIVFGASGLVGSFLVDELLADPAYALVTLVLRRPTDKVHPKLQVLIGDYESLPGLQQQIAADEVFIALGTTRALSPDPEVYYQVDHDYPVRAATIARDSGARAVFVVSAVSANAASRLFYVRTKGEMERDIIAAGLAHTHIFRPSLILGQRSEQRPLEKAMQRIWPLLHPLLPARYRGIEARDIARSMVAAARQQQAPAVRIYHWREMKALLR